MKAKQLQKNELIKQSDKTTYGIVGYTKLSLFPEVLYHLSEAGNNQDEEEFSIPLLQYISCHRLK